MLTNKLISDQFLEVDDSREIEFEVELPRGTFCRLFTFFVVECHTELNYFQQIYVTFQQLILIV